MEEKSKTKEAMEWVYCGIIAFVIVILIKVFVGIPTVVKQTSMYPTLQPDDRLWLNRWISTIGEMPKRGDIVTFEAPTDGYTDINHIDYENPVATYSYEPSNAVSKFIYYGLEIGKTSYIKRVIGLPGEHVEIKNGGVYINGKLLEEKYLQSYVVTDDTEGYYVDVVVPEGTVFVMGDNRGKNGSKDSRMFGCVPVEKIESKAEFRFWPINRIGGIYNDVR